MRFHCGCGKLIFCLYFIIFFAIFKTVVHSLEPGETPSYSASHQVLNYVQRIQTMYNVLKIALLNGCGAVAVNVSLYLCSLLYRIKVEAMTYKGSS